MKIIKILSFIFIIFFNISESFSAESFDDWIISFKKYAMKQGISKKTLDETMSNVKFLPKVIKYDRYQPEFYEDTNTYISKRSSDDKLKKGKNLFKKNSSLILEVESKYNVEKDALEPSDDLINGDSDMIKSIAANVKGWAGDWDAVWDNIILRQKIKEEVVDYAKVEVPPKSEGKQIMMILVPQIAK